MVTKFYKSLLFTILIFSFPVISNADIVDMMMSSGKNQSTIEDRRQKKSKSYKEKALLDKNLKQNIELTYNKKDTYRIRLSTYITTNIVLPKDEKIVSYSFGDSLNFSGSHSKNIPNILSLNAIENDLYTNLIIITEKQKIYNFTLFSIGDEKWQTPHYTVYMKKNQKEKDNIELVNFQQSNPDIENLESLNFNYKIKSSNIFLSEDEKDMIPEKVYDDGKFTYIKLSNSTRLPTIYEVVDGFDEVVNYKIQENLAVIESVSNTGFSLKNGDITICIRKENDI